MISSFRKSSRIERHAVGTAMLAAFALSATVDAAGYTITDLGLLPNGISSAGQGINSMAEVAGSSNTYSGERAFLFTAGAMLDLGLPPVQGVLSVVGQALNDKGAVVVNPSNGAPHAFIWQAGGYTDITNLANAIYSEGHRINNDGHVVGSVVLELPGNNFPHHAFLYDGSTMSDLNPFFGGDYSDAADINDSGTIVGEARFAGSPIIHGYVLQNGLVTNLGLSSPITSEANAINNNGDVAGGAYFDGVHEHPMKYIGGKITDLGLLPNTSGGTVTAINDAGIIVGFCFISSQKRGFLYSEGVMKDLTGLLPAGSGWTVQMALDINSAGKITGTARNAQGQKHAVILTPISTCPADLNGSGAVNVDDLLAVINAWGAAGGPADVNSDGIVNVDDLLMVINGWGPCP